MSPRRFSIIFLGLSLLAATTGCKREHVPDNLIDTATMTAILTEYYIIDGYDYVVASRHRDSLGFQSKAAKDSMLNKYNISQADIDSSLAYYVRHPKVFEAIMHRTISTLESRNNSLDFSDNQETPQGIKIFTSVEEGK